MTLIESLAVLSDTEIPNTYPLVFGDDAPLLQSVLKPTLLGGVEYCIVASAVTRTSEAFWGSVPNTSGVWVRNGDNGDWQFKSGTYDWQNGVRVFATPEPATMSMLAMGGLALIRRRRSA